MRRSQSTSSARRRRCAEPLPLEQHPVVVPVREQVAEQKRRRVGADDVGVALVEDMPRKGLGGVQVDLDRRPEPQPRAGRLDQAGAETLDAPECGTKAPVGMLLARIRPQRACHVRAQKRAGMYGEEREEALTAHRHDLGSTVAHELERVQQRQPYEPGRDSGCRG